jgi:hypothetical protein
MERPRLRSALPGPSRLAGHEGVLNSPAISKAIGPTSFCSRLWFVDNCNAREAVEGMNQVCAKDGGERVVSGIPPGGVMRKDGDCRSRYRSLIPRRLSTFPLCKSSTEGASRCFEVTSETRSASFV